MLLNQRIILVAMLCTFFGCQKSHLAQKNDKIYFDKILDSANNIIDESLAKAENYFDHSYQQIKNPSNIIKAKRNYFKAILALEGKTDTKLATAYIDSAIAYGKNEHQLYANDICDIYILKGKILIYQKKLNEALKYYFNAKEIAKKSDNIKQIADINANVGNVLFIQKKFSNAIIYFKKAKHLYEIVISDDINDSFIPTYQMLNNTGLCYERLNKQNEAISTYKKAINLISSGKSLEFPNAKNFIKLCKAVVYGNLGSAYLKNGDYRNAELWISKSIKFNHKTTDKDYIFNRIKLATVYLLTNRKTSAEPIIKEVETYQRSIQDDEIRLRLLELKKNYYDSVSDDYNAYLFYKNYHKLKDSLTNEYNKIYNLDFIQEFDKLENDFELEALKIKDSQKSFYLIVAASFSLLSIIIISLILKNNKTNKKHVKHLTVLNEEISKHNKVMQKTLQALEQSQAENSHVMQVLAHDMRTPIAGIKGLTDFLLAGGELNEEQIEIVEMINTSSNDSLNFINDLLQSQTNKINLVKEPVDLSSLINYCVILLKSKAQEKNIRLNTDVMPVEVIINREKVWRVMSNLISNAIKFSKNGSTVDIKIKKLTSSVLISIKDEGIGIPDSFNDKIFGMSAEVKRQGTDGEKSYGLGLAISKQIIEAHNGKIWFKTQVGLGTEFFVELPLAKENDIQQ